MNMVLRSDIPLQAQTYSAISRILHWLMAFLVFVMLALGWGRDFAPGPWRGGMMELHKSTGLVFLALAVARLAWRFYKKPPAYPDSLARLLKWAAHAMHMLLYVLLFTLPLSGWAMISAMGRSASFLGLFDFPPLLEKSRALVPVLKEIHGTGALVLITFVALHIGAALYHHVFLKDDTLSRMRIS